MPKTIKSDIISLPQTFPHLIISIFDEDNKVNSSPKLRPTVKIVLNEGMLTIQYIKLNSFHVDFRKKGSNIGNYEFYFDNENYSEAKYIFDEIVAIINDSTYFNFDYQTVLTALLRNLPR